MQVGSQDPYTVSHSHQLSSRRLRQKIYVTSLLVDWVELGISSSKFFERGVWTVPLRTLAQVWREKGLCISAVMNDLKK